MISVHPDGAVDLGLGAELFQNLRPEIDFLPVANAPVSAPVVVFVCLPQRQLRPNSTSSSDVDASHHLSISDMCEYIS